jgi:hypothetical protein
MDILIKIALWNHRSRQEWLYIKIGSIYSFVSRNKSVILGFFQISFLILTTKGDRSKNVCDTEMALIYHKITSFYIWFFLSYSKPETEIVQFSVWTNYGFLSLNVKSETAFSSYKLSGLVLLIESLKNKNSNKIFI